jgi:hypothetical protein
MGFVLTVDSEEFIRHLADLLQDGVAQPRPGDTHHQAAVFQPRYW